MAATNRLLVVDDEPGITRVIETVARALGYEVRSINDSDQFEKALTQFEPTIVCLDISMPGRDGVELIAVLAAGTYQGKIIVMSGSHPSYIQMSSTIGKVRDLNIAGTLPKPFRAAPCGQRTCVLSSWCCSSRLELGVRLFSLARV